MIWTQYRFRFDTVKVENGLNALPGPKLNPANKFNIYIFLSIYFALNVACKFFDEKIKRFNSSSLLESLRFDFLYHYRYRFLNNLIG